MMHEKRTVCTHITYIATAFEFLPTPHGGARRGGGGSAQNANAKKKSTECASKLSRGDAAAEA